MNENVAIQLENVSLDFPVTKSGARYIKDLLTGRNKSRSSKFYRAVDEMDLEIQTGEVFGVIGPNGAGKSTLLRVMAGIYAPDEGSVRVRGGFLCSLVLGLVSKKISQEERMYSSAVVFTAYHLMNCTILFHRL